MKTATIAISILSTISSVIATNAGATSSGSGGNNAGLWPYTDGQCIPGLKYCADDVEASTWAASDISQEEKNNLANVYVCRESQTGSTNHVEILGNCDDYHNGVNPDLAPDEHTCLIAQQGTVVHCVVKETTWLGSSANAHNNNNDNDDGDAADAGGIPVGGHGSAWKA